MKIELKNFVKVGLIIGVASFAFSCGGSSEKSDEGDAPQSMVSQEETVDPMKDKGIGPIKSVTLAAVDTDLAAAGEKVYNEKCTACHKADANYIGPAPKGILERRTPEWIMNMILNPEEMVVENKIAKDLLIEYNGAPMANQNLTEDEARSVLEYFRTL
jgi:cytochrome c